MSLTGSAMPDQLVADPVYAQLKGYVIESTGLAYYSDKDADFARRLRRRLANFGAPDCAAYLDVLRDPARGPLELEALIAEITIGETHFFRHQDHFDALVAEVFPEIIARRSSVRRLSIWCAGCADGAEPYSLSILLRRHLAQQLANWETSILGTDLNRQSLALAREGRYEEWSFRSTPDELRRTSFVREGKRWCLAPEYRQGVSFEYHNLIEDCAPCPGFDLIVCRNVMIYFAPDQMRRIVNRFHDGLAPGGWLLVGPAEPNMTCFTSFRAVNAPGVTLYQKPLPALPAAAVAPEVPQPLRATPIPTLEEVRRQADRGDWQIAAAGCEKLLMFDGMNPLIHLQHALVLEEMGRPREAERSLRRAIYLDRQCALAHYHLGRLLRARGDHRQAVRSFDNILELLSARSGAEGVSGDESVTVEQLRKLTEAQLETMGTRA
jgi:chemotaxis protein methyltransferase CheR